MPQEKLTPSLVFNNGVATPKHDEMLLLFSKDSQKLREYLVPILRYERAKKIRMFWKDYQNRTGEDNFKFIPKTRNIEITEWTPEKPIINKNYYIGSVDLYVLFKIKIDFDLLYNYVEYGFKSKKEDFYKDVYI